MKMFRKSSKTMFAFVMVAVLGVSLALFHLPNVLAENVSQEWKDVNGEWVEENGTFSPTTENAVMQYATKLSGDFKISFDLKLSATYDTMTGFQIALFANEDDADMAYAYAVNINTVDNSVSVLNNTEYTATVISTITTEKTLRDDSTRNVTIISYQDKLYVSYDGQKVVTGKAMTVTEGYLNLSAPSIYDAISNFTYATSYVPTEEEMANDQLLDVSIDFSDSSDTVDFVAGWIGWSLDSTTGAYKGTAWHWCYYANPLMLTKENVKTEVSFDFKASELINIGIVDAASADGKGLVAKIGNATSSRYLKVSENAANNDNTYMTNSTATYADDTWHDFKAEFKNGKAYLYIDGVAIYQGHSMATTPMYLFLQSGNGSAYIDNLTIKETTFILDVPFEENVNETVSDTVFFAHENTGWQIVDGKYSPKVAWANTYYNQLLDLTKPTQISFDFCLEKPETDVFDNTMQFKVSFATRTDTWSSESLNAYFYNNSNWKIYMSTLNTSFASPTGATWLADNTTNYFDGKEHHMTITVKKGMATYAVDGVALFAERAVPSEKAHLVFASSLTSTYIDNLEIINLVDYSKDFDFSSSTHGDEFVGGYGKLQVADGVFKPDRPWATTYMKDAVTLKGSNTLEVDFCVSSSWKAGLVEWVEGGNTGKGLVLFVEDGQVILRDGSTGSDTWIKSQQLNYMDSQTHTLSITIKNGSANFAIDGTMLFENMAISVNFAHFWTQIAGGYDASVPVNYIDDLKILKTIDVTDKVLEDVAVEEKEVLLGYKVVGGRYDGFYPVGMKIEYIDSMKVEPVIVDFYMNYGASIRLATEGGIRWTTQMPYTDYRTLQSLGVEYSFGTLVTSPGSSSSVNIPVLLSGYQKDGNFIWHGGLKNIKQVNYDRQLAGTGYMSITYTDGTEKAFSAITDDNQRSYYQIVQAALNDVQTTSTGEYTTLVADLNGKEVYTCYSVAQYNILKERYTTIKNYLDSITK